jgi:hypothetical protein
VATQAFQELIGIIGQYVNPLKAQIIVEKYCNECNISCEEFSTHDLPNFILYFAKERDSVVTLDDKRFFVLLGNLVSYSNNYGCNEEVGF